MSPATVMLFKTAVVFALFVMGWFARRRGLLAENALGSCSRFCIDVALPCLIFSKILATVTRADLARDGAVVAIGVLVVALAAVVARLAAWGVPDDERPTFGIVVAFPNWLYLALAVLEPVYGTEATRTLLLVNVGVHAYLWTVGIAPFGAARESFGRRLRRIALNPAFLATAAGLATVWFHPACRDWLYPPGHPDHGAVWPAGAGRGDALAMLAVDAMAMMGAVAIPLNLALVGAQLAYLPALRRGGKRLLARMVVLRLAVAPALTGALFAVAARLGWSPTAGVFCTLWLMSAMPTAVVCGLITEVYGGDTPLAARGILVTTLLSLATLPLWTSAAAPLYAWAMAR